MLHFQLEIMRDRSKAKLILIGILLPAVVLLLGAQFLLNARPQTVEFDVAGNSVQVTVSKYRDKDSMDLPVGYDLTYSVNGTIADVTLQNTEATSYSYTFRIEVGVSTYNVTFFQHSLSLTHSIHTNIPLGDSVLLTENIAISSGYTIAAHITVT